MIAVTKCAFCGGDIKSNPDDLLLICPFCGTAQTVEGAKLKEHYMIRVHFDQNQSFTTLLDWVSKQLGVPGDLGSTAHLLKAEQIWYPFWVSRIDAQSSYKGLGRDATFSDEWPQYRGAYKRIDFFWKPESGEFSRNYEIKVPGVGAIDQDIKSMAIPTRAKEYFSHDHAEQYGGTLLHSQMSEDGAKAAAKQIALDRQTGLITQEISKIESRDDKVNIGETFLVHVPVWEIQYRYGNKSFKASVSASTGYVIESEYPRSAAFRAMGLGLGFVLLIIGAVLLAMGLGVLEIPFAPIQELVGAYVGGDLVAGGLLMAVALVFMYKGASRKQAKEKE
ncbi:MAG: hypothetical protein C4K47_05475 [Candidatus Thorarchaeota archaeon]|nr:MAG: hypothetical protein C4K47_05475 [Candidatus Thorarchaeota archaeon]